ncbi:MAG TPA: PilZ domain-containing protein [Kiloniellaceae bacterium]|nr:PilZ domain-containing protein [Kiloniellaceae bacterium]
MLSETSQATAAPSRNDRATVIRTGAITFDGRDRMNCTVMDLSDKGARLRPDDPLKIPDAFSLHLRDIDALPCQVTWRAGLYIGVRFSDLAGNTAPAG